MVPPTAPGTRVVAYVRVSTSGQAESGLGLADQRAKIESFAGLHDLIIVDTIADEGLSAKSLDRPGLQRALGMLREGHADGILVARLDRLTRSVRDLADLLDEFFSPGKHSLLSAMDSIDTRSAMGRFFIGLMAQIGQWERETISERVTAALAVKRTRGERISRHAPYGCKFTEEGQIVPEPQEQAVLDRARALRAEGRSLSSISETLAAEGIYTRNGGKFTVSAIHKMVKQAP